MSREITNISIDVLKVHPRNTEFFDDISGQEYEEFKNSIKEEGIISEIIVAPDMTIISGHQRYKAAKDLGIAIVPIRIREDLIDEDKKLKVLLAANFGRSKNDDIKQRRVANEYVRLCGCKAGDNQWSDQNGLTLEQIAKQLGTTRTNLKRMIRIERNLTESMKELLDTGLISKTLAADTIAALTIEEQEELISKLDVTKKHTDKEVKKYIEKIKELETKAPEIIDNTDYEYIEELEEEISSLKEKIKKSSTCTSKTDSELKKKITKLESEISSLKDLNETLERSRDMSEKLAAQYKQASDEYTHIKSKIIEMGLEPDGEYNLYSATAEIAKLNEEMQNMLLDRLSPIRYEAYMITVKSSGILRKNFKQTLDLIYDWYLSMLDYIGEESEITTNDEIIDMEDF